MNMKIDYRPLDEIITLVNGKKITLGYDFQSEIIEDTSNSRMKDKSKNFTEMTAKIKNREKLSKESGGFEINDF